MAELKLAIALFDTTRAIHPRRAAITWPELAKLLTHHKIRQGKDGPVWSPTLYKESATRGNAGVASLCCLVLDFDDGTAPDALISDWTRRGLAFVAHSTYSHAASSPRWRAVFPLAKPIGPLRWKEIYQALAADLGRGTADPACKDPARIYYLPAHPPGITPFTHSQVEGKHLSLSSEPGITGGQGGKKLTLDATAIGRPGADYDARVTQAEVLALLGKYGWREMGRRDGVVALTRPGKTEGVSGVLGFSAGEPTLFYCYSSNAQPLESGKLYSPFALRTALEHGGRFEEAAKALAAEGYGKRAETKPLTLAQLNQTDAGNAERLVQCYGQNLRYVIGLGWRVWDGKRWTDDDLGVMAKARDTVRALYAESTLLMAEAHALKDTDERQALARKVDGLSRFALKSESTRALHAMVEQARSFPALLCDADQFALKPWLVPFPNGTWDKGEFRAHRRDDYAERLLAVRYEPKVDRSEWAALLTRMSGGDVDLEQTLQDVAGYALSGASSLRVLPWLWPTRHRQEHFCRTASDRTRSDRKSHRCVAALWR